VPADTRQWYADFCDAYRERPGSAWGPALSPAQVAPVATVNIGRVRRRWTLPRPQRVVPSLAAAMVTLAVCLVLAFGGSTVPPPAQVNPVQVNGTPAVWRLAGFINADTWRSGGALESNDGAVACPAGSVCYANAEVFVGGGTVVMKSDDGGATWGAAPLPTGWKMSTAVSCLDVRRCVVGADRTSGTSPGLGGQSAVLATSDGGDTWVVQPMTPGVAMVVDVTCGSPTACVAIAYGPSAPTGALSTAVAVVTSDGGRSWTKVVLPGPFFEYGAGLSCPTAAVCVVVGSSSFGGRVPAALYSADGGHTWQRSAVPTVPVPLRAVSCASADHCVAIGDTPLSGNGPQRPSEALVSDSGGRSWSTADQIGHEPMDLESVSCPSAEDCWAAGRVVGEPLGVIEATHDGGTTWTSLPLPSTLTPTQRVSSGLSSLQIQDVSSVSCPSTGPCSALGAQASGVGAGPQLVLRGGGVQGAGT